MSPSLEDAVATQRRLLEPIADVIDRGDHVVFRSDRFPTYYVGNGIEIRDASARRDLQAWEALFDEHFERDRFKHTTFTFKRDPQLEPLAHAARAAGYNAVVFLTYLIATVAEPPGPPPKGFTVEQVASEAEWDRLRIWDNRVNRDKPWYIGPEDNDRMFAKTRYVSEQVGIEWLTLVDADGEIASKLGLFRHGPVYRLQDVATAPEYRRRGLSTHLLRVALHRAIEEGGADGLVVEADTDYHAIELYRRVGFRDVGERVEMIRFPS